VRKLAEAEGPLTNRGPRPPNSLTAPPPFRVDSICGSLGGSFLGTAPSPFRVAALHLNLGKGLESGCQTPTYSQVSESLPVILCAVLIRSTARTKHGIHPPAERISSPSIKNRSQVTDLTRPLGIAERLGFLSKHLALGLFVDTRVCRLKGRGNLLRRDDCI
jgi:hypothetical protein